MASAQICSAGTITRAGGIWCGFPLSADFARLSAAMPCVAWPNRVPALSPPKSGSAKVGNSHNNLPGSQVFPEAGENPFGA